MEITKLSREGQITIPEPIINSHQWESEQEFVILEVGDGILLKPHKKIVPTTLDDVAGCLKYHGDSKTIQEMNEAIDQGIEEVWHDCSGH